MRGAREDLQHALTSDLEAQVVQTVAVVGERSDQVPEVVVERQSQVVRIRVDVEVLCEHVVRLRLVGDVEVLPEIVGAGRSERSVRRCLHDVDLGWLLDEHGLRPVLRAQLHLVTAVDLHLGASDAQGEALTSQATGVDVEVRPGGLTIIHEREDVPTVRGLDHVVGRWRCRLRPADLDRSAADEGVHADRGHRLAGCEIQLEEIDLRSQVCDGRGPEGAGLALRRW